MYDELIGELYLTASTALSKSKRELLEKAADAIEELQEDNAALNGTVSNLIEQIAELSKPRWIPVTERLPESGTHALVMRFDFVTKTPFYDLLWFDKGKWWNRHFAGDYAVTHWMPLPEPPQEET